MDLESSMVSEDSDLEGNKKEKENNYGHVVFNCLTHMQEEIIYAIETLNYTFFIDLGGSLEINLDFDCDMDKNFPLGIA